VKSASGRVVVALLIMIGALLMPGATRARSTAGAVTIKTNWNENVEFQASSGKGDLRLHVRRLEFTARSWKAWVGLTNRSSGAVTLTSSLERPDPQKPFLYWAGPGLWWSTYVANSGWYPGSGTVLTRSTRAVDVRPKYPNLIAAGKSWFGTFSGSLAAVPKDRLLRVGFGTLVLPGHIGDATGTPPLKIPVSTTHQFKLPRAR
jgi:hypothetical protein